MERAARSRAPDVDKKKYLVPSDLTGEAFHLNSQENVIFERKGVPKIDLLCYLKKINKKNKGACEHN